ncbi:zeta toxin family protein [Mucilaginibacter sp.]|uniref:zeta toxin family protein n=1 Tax=Mucilaginibacter sp. TaxID=1882438 RepID=UPI003AFFC036
MLDCKEFINADEIAKGISPFQPETVSFLAGRIMLERINELLEQQIDFAIETTLTTLSYQKTIAVAKSKGYRVTLIFFWLNDVNLAIERVKMRVAEGGHNIPKEVIIRRYYKGIFNLINVFTKLCDDWIVINNSYDPYYVVANGKNNLSIEIKNRRSWMQILNLADGKS